MSAALPPLFDTHAHLDDERFRDDLPAVVARARAAGVARVITVGTTAATSRRSIELARTFDLLAPAVGIQPNHAAEAAPGDWDVIVGLADSKGVAAVGETGLDRHWDYTPFPTQEDYFDRHLALARRTGLPVIIHCREAEPDMVRVLRGHFDRLGPVRGVMHSFTGDEATAAACLAMGLFISFAGMVTYKSAGRLREVAATIPADRILVETDAPYLAPVPHRGERNEPAFVRFTVEQLAPVRGVAAEALAEQTTANARALFG